MSAPLVDPKLGALPAGRLRITHASPGSQPAVTVTLADGSELCWIPVCELDVSGRVDEPVTVLARLYAAGIDVCGLNADGGEIRIRGGSLYPRREPVVFPDVEVVPRSAFVRAFRWIWRLDRCAKVVISGLVDSSTEGRDAA